MFLEGQELAAGAEWFSIQEVSLWSIIHLTHDLLLLSTCILKFHSFHNGNVGGLTKLNGGIILTVKNWRKCEKRSSKVALNPCKDLHSAFCISLEFIWPRNYELPSLLCPGEVQGWFLWERLPVMVIVVVPAVGLLQQNLSYPKGLVQHMALILSMGNVWFWMLAKPESWLQKSAGILKRKWSWNCVMLLLI